MKKITKLFIAMLVSLVVVTGCGNKKNSLSLEETSKKMSTNMEALENYKLIMNAGIGMKADEQEINAGINLNASYDNKNSTAKFNVSYDLMGEKASIDMYMEFDKDGKKATIYVQNPDDSEEWLKTSIDMNELGLDTMGIDMSNIDGTIISKLFGNDKLKQVDADANNYNYEMVITAEDLKNMVKNLISSLGDDIDVVSDAESTINTYLAFIKGSITVKVSIEKDNYYLSGVTIDLTDMLDQTINGLGLSDTKITVSKAELTMSLLDFNKTGNVEIPASVKEKAIDTSEQTKQIEKETAETVAYGIQKSAQLYYTTKVIEGDFEGVSFVCDGFDCSNDDDELDISGTIPDSGVISIDDDGTIYGIVSIDGYNCDLNYEPASCE